MAADWTTISSLATAGGTLVLAAATFAAVRSANRSARATERALLAGIRPVLVPSRMEDPPQKVGFRDQHWVRVPGGRAVAEVTDEAIYLAIACCETSGTVSPCSIGGTSTRIGRSATRRTGRPMNFNRLTCDIYVPANDQGFWQGVFREPSDPSFAAADAMLKRQPAGRSTRR